MIHLYSDSRCPFSHWARIVLNLKNMDYKIIDVGMHINDLMLVNPYNETPVLVDDIDKNNKKKDLVLLAADVICEYIDDRFPHPQLMPIEPAEKARLRMMITHMDRELFTHIRFLDQNLNTKDAKIKKDVEKSRKKVTDGLDSIANVFVVNKKTEFLFGTTFTLLDAAILPLLWRLEYYGITTKPSWAGLLKYAEKQFNTEAFVNSLTPAERGMKVNTTSNNVKS